MFQFYHGVVFVPVMLSILPDSLISRSPNDKRVPSVSSHDSNDDDKVCIAAATMIILWVMLISTVGGNGSSGVV